MKVYKNFTSYSTLTLVSLPFLFLLTPSHCLVQISLATTPSYFSSLHVS